MTIDEGITFCTNEFSDRAAKLESSALFMSFSRRGGPITPKGLEQDNRRLAMRDWSIDRRDETAVVSHLSEKYGLKHAMLLDMRNVSAAVVVKEDPNKGSL